MRMSWLILLSAVAILTPASVANAAAIADTTQLARHTLRAYKELTAAARSRPAHPKRATFRTVNVS